MKGSEFITSLAGVALGPARSAAILAALENEIPWALCDVPIVDKDGHTRGSFQCTADYFAIGDVDAKDLVRVPVDGPTSQRIADARGMVIPTPKMVGLIHRAATINIQPILRAPSPAMTSVEWFVEHSKRIDMMIGLRADGRSPSRGDLVSDVKKNVVRSQLRVARPSQLALFGEHVLSPVQLSHADGSPRIVQPGEPIQTLTLFHDEFYADESHGLRLCSAKVTIDGEEYGTDEALQSPTLAELISDEGVLTGAALRYAS